jgi:putative glycosyltransferase (TIGR04348 family)
LTRVVLVTPADPSDRTGNTVTAQRWARLLRRLGCRVRVIRSYDGEPCDLLIALHARKSAPSVARLRRASPDTPVVVALTGTDLYRDLRRSGSARRTLDAANRIVVLQPLAPKELPARYWPKTVVIRQSVRMPWTRPLARARHFDVVVLSHLRRVKDPLRAAQAARLLPPESRIRVQHAGAALEPAYLDRVRAEARRNPRYVWKGELPRWQAKRLLASSRLLLVTSRLEGGPNVISEAAVAGVPILATRIPGNVGLLGKGYPGYFDVGDTEGLAALMRRAETDRAFYVDLARRVRAIGRSLNPARELAAWKLELEELCGGLGS